MSIRITAFHLAIEVENTTFAASMEEVSLHRPASIRERLYDYAQLTKLKLSLLVVFSAGMGFLTAPGAVEWQKFLLLIIGGFLVTGASNGFNQIFEKDLDKLMSRTALRPLADNRMSVGEALSVCLLSGFAGIVILTLSLNLYSGLLGLFAMISYSLIYTPLKRKTPFCVFIGAIPGAIPPMLGWVAATGSFGIEAWILFTIQFLWQFPHFWAIAWVLDDDYKKAGFIMLPSGNRDKRSSLQTLIYTVSLIPVAFLPFIFGISGLLSAIVCALVTFYFVYTAYRLHRSNAMEDARKVMFASFIFLPVVQLIIMLNKV